MTGFSSVVRLSVQARLVACIWPADELTCNIWSDTACSKRCRRVGNEECTLIDGNTQSSHLPTLPTFGIPTMPVLRAMLTTEVLQQQAPVLENPLAFWCP